MQITVCRLLFLETNFSAPYGFLILMSWKTITVQNDVLIPSYHQCLRVSQKKGQVCTQGIEFWFSVVTHTPAPCEICAGADQMYPL